MTQKQLAIIQEQNCIGCTKCIDVCPTDAIIGADQLMHTVVLAECIGCTLCVPACPVDCIDLMPVPLDYAIMPKEVINSRIKRRKTRLQLNESIFASNETLDERKQYILNALARAKKK